MSMEFTLNDLQRRRVEEHLALVEQVLRRSIKTNETVDGMGHDDLYQEGCIALCRAAVSYREEMGAFPAYARTVIRNYLLDRCREIQSARKNLPLLSLDAFAEMGAPEPVSPFHMEDLISDVSSDALLSHFRNRYHGTARLGIEALELRVRGYSCADIAKLYQKKPNYIGACISRAAEKLRRERIVREFYTACTEQDKLMPEDIEPQENKKVVQECVGVTCTKLSSPWTVYLSTLIAAHYCCRPYRSHAHGSKVSEIGFIGMEDDFKLCKLAFLYAYDCISSRCRQIRTQKGYPAKTLREMCNSYGWGFCRGLSAAFQKQEAEHQEWGLVMVVPQAVEDAVSKMKRSSYKISSTSSMNRQYAAMGYADGQEFDMRRRLAPSA